MIRDRSSLSRVRLLKQVNRLWKKVIWQVNISERQIKIDCDCCATFNSSRRYPKEANLRQHIAACVSVPATNQQPWSTNQEETRKRDLGANEKKKSSTTVFECEWIELRVECLKTNRATHPTQPGSWLLISLILSKNIFCECVLCDLVGFFVPKLVYGHSQATVRFNLHEHRAWSKYRQYLKNIHARTRTQFISYYLD